MVLSRGSQLLTGVRIRDIKSEQKWTADSGDTAVLSLAIVNLPVGVRPSKNLNIQRRRNVQGEMAFLKERETVLLPFLSQGRVVVGDGSIYDGMWLKGKRCGLGTFYSRMETCYKAHGEKI
ncbi:unnamed protein product [Brassica rapa]|uniref:Uncharacterized protein n=1 Tax=Brassica campestris TaxID=3711 RepID=A0A8D9H640_BRACM|nr:unnamed protein product [Brassica rapa]